MQCFPVPGDEQQRVVRADAEHQDRQQRRVLVVDHDAEALDEQVDGRHRGQCGRAHGHQRDQPQHRAAIGDDEQERDDDDGGEEDLHVDAVEDGLHVAVDRGRAGHVEFQAGGAVLRGVTQRADEGLRCAVGRAHREGEHHRLPVGGGSHRRALVLVAGRHLRRVPLGKGVEVALDRRAVGGGQAAGAVVHEDELVVLTTGQTVLVHRHLGGLGTGRQGVRGAVGGDRAQLSAQRHHEHRQHHPQADHQPRHPPTGQPTGRCFSGRRCVDCHH
jgi:hypothetical protein